MVKSAAIVSLTQWLETPAGQYVMDSEQRYLDQVVADIFGFHALQLGVPQLDALRANRMPHRWQALDHALGSNAQALLPSHPSSLRCDFDALPFTANTLDLVVLPHTLELSSDPHLTLREVERVLLPEGRVVIVGFNPVSLWGLRQSLSGSRQRFSRSAQRFLPSDIQELIGHRRLRDWLKLLGFEVESSQFACYRSPARSQTWLQRAQWMEKVGRRWWPVFGAVYMITAVKRVRGMRLVGLAQQVRSAQKARAVPAASASSLERVRKQQD
jgi:SAM-dependent methyltransferase